MMDVMDMLMSCSSAQFLQNVRGNLLLISVSRLRLSPSPPPGRVISVTRTSGSGTQTRLAQSSSSTRTASGSAKKRRLNDTDSEASSVTGGTVTRTRISQQASASGRVTVDEVDLEGKYVRLSNKSDQVRGQLHHSSLLGNDHRNGICEFILTSSLPNQNTFKYVYNL